MQALVTGWAPGNQDLVLPPDVGLELAPPTGNYVLELHYSNPTGKPFKDASGVRVCASTKFRPKTASITWTGTERINVPPRAAGSASGKCIPGRINMGPTDPIHIFAAWPHMHKLGTRMSTIINRAGGTQEVLIDKPFNFASQVSYPTPAVISPGRLAANDLLLRQPRHGFDQLRPEHDARDVFTTFSTLTPRTGLRSPRI